MNFLKTDGGYIINMDRGDKINAILTEFVKSKNIPGGIIQGLGAVKNIELGIYHLHLKKYEKKLFEHESELLNLTGNIGWLNGNPIIHTHATLCDGRFSSYGGHMFEAEVHVTVEISISLINTNIQRKYNEAIGLNLLCLG